MKDKDNEFEFFDLDLNRLDKEWISQPKIYFKYASKLADARRELEEQKAELDIVRAEIDKEIRDDPALFDIVKTTETLITNTILQQKRYQEAQAKVRTAKHDMDILQAAVSALDHRKAALENAVKLHGQNYFSTPVATDENSKEIVDDIEKRSAREPIKDKRRKRVHR